MLAWILGRELYAMQPQELDDVRMCDTLEIE